MGPHSALSNTLWDFMQRCRREAACFEKTSSHSCASAAQWVLAVFAKCSELLRWEDLLKYSPVYGARTIHSARSRRVE